MGYIVGRVTAETPEGRPSEIERLSFLDRNEFDFSTAIGFAERLLEERNTSDNIVVTTDRALQNISEQHPELDVIWSSHDSPVLRNRYLGLSNEQWTETEDHSFMFEVQSDKPSVYFDIDGTLGKWYADGRGYSSLEEIIDPANHYFRDIEPHEFMIQLAEELQNRGRDVCIISAADRDTIRDKMEWVHENMPFIKDENVFFSPIGTDKTKFIKDNAEISVLIDDYNKNLDVWKGQAVKAINTVNSHQDKYPEIDMTIPEAEMLKNKERLEKIERLAESGAFPERDIDDMKMSMAQSMARQLKNACLIVEDALTAANEKIKAINYEIEERNNDSMVTKEENGYSVNGRHIDSQAARELAALAEMVEEDELIPTVEGYVKILEGMETIKEVEQMPTIETAAELEEALKSNKLTLEDVEDLKDRFSIVPMYEHLEENYGTAYELIDALGSDDIISIDSDVSYPEWTADDNELGEIKDEISENVLGYLETLEPMLAVDKAGNEAVIPIYRNLDGKLLSADDVNKAISELVPEKIEITLYGEKIDHDYYTQPYHPERQVEADVDTTFDAVDFLLKEAKECVNEVKYDYYRQKDSELIYDMIESANCSVKVNEAGTYDVYDSVKGEYRATDCENLLQVIDSLDTLVENNLLDYTANELYQSDDFEKHGEGVEIPQTAEEWKAIFDSPDFAEFSAGHQTEMQEIALLADPNRLKDANIEYVANTFYPEDKEYTAYQLQALCKDKTVFMHGRTYTATTDAEKVFAEPSYSSLYKIELNKADMTFDVHDTDDIRAVKEQELSTALADFINSKDMELDVIETNGFNRYVLYDKDTGDYRKDENGKAEYLHNAEDLLTNMNVYVEEVQDDLEEAFLDTYGDSKEVPSIASEWVSFAGRESNSEFVKDCKAELDLMRLAHESNSASISKVYEMQNERQEQTKEQPAKNHKKFDKTDD